MRTLSKTDTPIGLAILLSIVAWLCLQIVEQLRSDLIISSEVMPVDTNGEMVLQLRNESLTRMLLNASFMLKCPTARACLKMAFTSSPGDPYARSMEVAPWNMDPTVTGTAESITIFIPALPPGGVTQVRFTADSTNTRPVFYYDLRDDPTLSYEQKVQARKNSVATLLPASHPMVFLSRHYFEILAMSLVAVIALAGWWLFNPE